MGLKMKGPHVFKIQIILKKLHLKTQLYLIVWVTLQKKHEQAMPGTKADSKAEVQKGQEVIQNFLCTNTLSSRT